MSDPLVSVVIPAFNRADCILRTIASIESQTYPNWEIVVVDDGSTDGTVDTVQEVARREPRVRLVIQPRNRGAQVARNAGIEAARGEWIAFLDSDDQWVPDSLRSRLDVARAAGVSVVHSGGDMLSETGETTRLPIPPLSGRVYAALVRSEGPMFQALLVKRDALDTIGGLDERIVAFQEWDTVLSLAKRYEFGYAPTSTFVWDCRRTDTMSKNFLRAGQGYEQVFHKRFIDMLTAGGPGVLAEHYRRAAKWYVMAGASRPASRCIAAARFWAALDLRAVRGLLRLSRRMWAE